jgi:preprotein translocase subunit SecD
MILFIFWINIIKWFGLMLGLWIIVSLFSVMWISRVLVFLAAEKAKNEKNFVGK